MKPKQKDVATWIAKAGKTEQTREFEYPYGGTVGFHVTIAFGSRFILNQIRQLAAEPYTDRRTRTREEKLNDEKLQLGYAERIVKDWRGLTVGKLENFIPGTVDEAIEQYEEAAKENSDIKVPSVEEIKAIEVEYSVETAAQILGNSIDFMNWIVDVAGEAKNYAKVGTQKEKDYKNLKK